MNAFYVAVAICIGSPGNSIWDENGMHFPVPCNYGEWFEGVFDGEKMSLDECKRKLATMHERGNIVKFCAGESASIEGLVVEWDKPR